LVFAGPRAVRIEPTIVPRVGADQIRVRSLISGISHGTEMAWYQGRASALRKSWDPAGRVFNDGGPGRSYPVAPGYELVGVIDDVGAEVDAMAPGDLVYVDRPHATTHVVPADSAAPIPASLTAEAAVFYPLSRVALGAVHDADLRIGDTAAVIGVGVVGLLAVALARHAGAAQVVAVDRYRVRLEAAARLGAEVVNVERVADPARALRELLGGGPDVVIEASGSYQGLHQAIRSCCVGARVVTVGSYHGQASSLALGEEYHRNRIDLVSSMTVNGCPHRQAPRWDLQHLDLTARRLVKTGVLPVDQLISHRMPFQQAADAYALVADRPETTIKVVLTYEH
jgi:2-desacetyl-2-hydroxyethyl bacteriochlorophyllide A dehydrogenase